MEETAGITRTFQPLDFASVRSDADTLSKITGCPGVSQAIGGVDLCQLHDSVEDVHIILRPDLAVLIKGPKAHALGPQIFRQSIQDRFREICADPFAQRQNFDGLDRQLLWRRSPRRPDRGRLWDRWDWGALSLVTVSCVKMSSACLGHVSSRVICATARPQGIEPGTHDPKGTCVSQHQFHAQGPQS